MVKTKHIEQLLHDLCPNGVEYKTLGDLGMFYGGLTGKNKIDFQDGNAKYITYLNIGNNPALNLDINDTVKVGPTEKQNIVVYGDILFTGSSETPDECAMSSVVTERPKENLYLNSFCFGFRFNNLENINPLFYKHYFRSDSFRMMVRRTANGVTRFNVSKKDFADLFVPIPPFQIQSEIARILEIFDNLKDNIDAEIVARQQQLETAKELFLGESEEQSTDNKTLGEVCLPVKNIKWRDITPMEDFFYIDLTSVNRENRNIENPQTINKENAPSRAQQIIKEGDILFGTTRPTLQRYCYVTDKYDNQICSTGYCVLRANRELVLPKWIYYQLSLQRFVNYVENSQSGAAYPSMSDSAVKSYSIPLPSLKEQQAIAAKLDTIEAFIANLNEERTLRQQQYEYYRAKLISLLK